MVPSKCFPFNFSTNSMELESVANETSETIADLLLKSMTNFEVRDKCIAYGGDNTNTNFGGVNRKPGCNVYTRLKTILGRDIYGIGCPAHISNEYAPSP